MTSALKLPMADYIADKLGTDLPTLNSGLANRLMTRSPLHAWWGHPRLNLEYQSEESDAFDLGTAAHESLIEGRSRVVVCHYPDWRTKAAKDERDALREAGKIPLLPDQALAVDRMTTAAQLAMAASTDLDGLGELVPEQTLLWMEEGVYLRCRPDWMSEDATIILSYKTTGVSAEPESFAKHIINMGYDMQMAFETSAVEAVFGTRVTHYVWIVQETAPPYAVSLIGCSPEMRQYGMDRMGIAVSRWADCLARDRWPGYPRQIAYVSPPRWAMSQLLERLEA